MNSIMSNLTFLTQEQCFGIEKLDILQKRGTKAAISDFSILLGGEVSNSNYIDNSSLRGCILICYQIYSILMTFFRVYVIILI